jgi:poly(A) polymerase
MARPNAWLSEMRRPKDHLPAPPDLPSFTVEDSPRGGSSGANPTMTGPDAPDAQRIEERHADTGLVRHDVAFDEDRIDPDAAKVVRRLERSGFQAYLVGGCVRDLLLGRKPKDFDIATNARPQDVRALFRNCRIIGRRFLLANVLFGGGKVVEVATFRRNPQTEVPEEEPTEVDDDLLIRSDNVFGDAHEDAIRRDFTCNALFYDLDRRQVLDWCGGMDDVRRRTIHTVGDPTVRFREDPVRILRAIKFAGRLDLGIHPDVYDAMTMHRGELAKAARPRLCEEVLRLLRGGGAHRSMWLLWEVGAMSVLLPELAAFLDDDEATQGGGERFWRKMDTLDARVRESGGPPEDVVLWTTLLQEPLEEACAGVRDSLAATYDFLEAIIERIAMPRRIADALRRIVAIQPRLAQGRPGRFARTELIGPALDVLEIDWKARGKSTELVDRMRAEALPLAAAPTPGRRAPHRRSRVARRG